MYVCIYIYREREICMHIYIYVHTCISNKYIATNILSTPKQEQTKSNTGIQELCIYIYIHIYTYIYLAYCACIHVYILIYIYIHTYIHIYIERERHIIHIYI